MNLEHVTSADDVLDAARYVLGPDFAPPEGVVQTVSTTPDGHVIRVGSSAPKSAWDFFLLHLARASADAIITTGKILRDEPGLRYDLEGPSRALHAYREKHAKKPAPASVVVLTRGDVDLAHPALSSWARPVIAMPTETPFADAARARGLRVLIVDTLPALVRALRAEVGCVSVEGGPTATRVLYDTPTVNALWHSRFEGAITDDAVGLPFFTDAALQADFGPPKHVRHVAETSGSWTFSRYAR